MLLNLSIDNWMSFKNTVSFSMLASRERQHGERVARVSKYKARILPIVAIYGGNASGKTNFCKALSFMKKLVVEGTQPDSLIPVEPFQLDNESIINPTRFSIEMLINETIYEFSIAVTNEAVVEEKLVLISSTSEKILYNRRDGKANFDSILAKNEFLKFAFQGTRKNQLFLTNAISQNVDEFRPVYDWFKHVLTIISPTSQFVRFDQFINEEKPFYSKINEMISQLDTGIVNLGIEDIPLGKTQIPEEIKNALREEVKKGITALISSPDHGQFLVTREGGDLRVQKLVTFHRKTDGSKEKFEIKQESDGSKRIIDLLPVFLDASSRKHNKVFIIDELDRSLHTLLIRQLLESYLANCSSETRSQLLFTTHDVLLMDQQLLRRDEMWVAERDVEGWSKLFSFSEFEDIRYDKDIRKSYLQGRMGGVPQILLNSSFTACKE